MPDAPAIHYLTAAQGLFIHDRLIAETGGSADIRDLGLLAAAVARPQATFDGVDLYPDHFTKAAALMASLVNNHPSGFVHTAWYNHSTVVYVSD